MKSWDGPLFWGLAALVVWAPIPLGSNRPWAWATLEIGAYGLLAAWLVLFALGRVRISEALAGAKVAWVALGIWLVLEALYILPLPHKVVAVVSPAAEHMQALVGDIGIQRERWTLSVEPHASRVSLLKTIAYVAIFFLTLALLNRRSRVVTFARVVVYAAVALSAYAVLMHLANVTQDFFGSRIAHGSSASGTYVNRNHFAGYLELTLAIGIGLLIADLSDRTPDSWRKFARMTIEWILSPKMVLRLALCVLVIALTTTHSRTGNTAFFSALIVAGVVGIALSRYATRNTVILLASLVAIDLLIVGSWFGVEKLAKRIEQTTVEDVQQREEPAEYSLQLIRDFAPLGSGPGTFYVAFPRYRAETVLAFFDHAHNDYAEIASESGPVGLAILGVFVTASLAAALVAQWRRRDPLMRGMAFACVMGTTSLLIHSWTDFNLQLPANAALFMITLAFGWIALFLDRRERADTIRARTRHLDS